MNDSKNRFAEFGENFVRNLEKNGVTELQSIVQAVNTDKEIFYNYNDIFEYQNDSPIFRGILVHVEKKFDTLDLTLRKWCTMLKEIGLSEATTIKSIEIFSNQLLQDKKIFKNNKELYNLIFVFAQFLKEQIIYREIMQKTIIDAIQA